MILIFILGLVALRVLYSVGEICYERDWPRDTWKGLLIALGVLCIAVSAFGQAARVDLPLLTSGPSVPISGGPLPQALWVANSLVYVCTHPSATLAACQAAPVTTYTDSTEGTTCPSTAQMVQLPGNTCTASSGTTANVGFWYAGGLFDYWIVSSYGTYGPFSGNNSNFPPVPPCATSPFTSGAIARYSSSATVGCSQNIFDLGFSGIQINASGLINTQPSNTNAALYGPAIGGVSPAPNGQLLATLGYVSVSGLYNPRWGLSEPGYDAGNSILGAKDTNSYNKFQFQDFGSLLNDAVQTGNISVVQQTTPSGAPVATAYGTGATTYSYKIGICQGYSVATNTCQGMTVPGPASNTVTNASTLVGGNPPTVFNGIILPAGADYESCYYVLRSTNGGAYQSVAPCYQVGGDFIDTDNAPAPVTIPTQNTTGTVTAAGNSCGATIGGEWSVQCAPASAVVNAWALVAQVAGSASASSATVTVSATNYGTCNSGVCNGLTIQAPTIAGMASPLVTVSSSSLSGGTGTITLSAPTTAAITAGTVFNLYSITPTSYTTQYDVAFNNAVNTYYSTGNAQSVKARGIGTINTAAQSLWPQLSYPGAPTVLYPALPATVSVDLGGANLNWTGATINTNIANNCMLEKNDAAFQVFDVVNINLIVTNNEAPCSFDWQHLGENSKIDKIQGTPGTNWGYGSFAGEIKGMSQASLGSIAVIGCCSSGGGSGMAQAIANLSGTSGAHVTSVSNANNCSGTLGDHPGSGSSACLGYFPPTTWIEGPLGPHQVMGEISGKPISGGYGAPCFYQVPVILGNVNSSYQITSYTIVMDGSQNNAGLVGGCSSSTSTLTVWFDNNASAQWGLVVNGSDSNAANELVSDADGKRTATLFNVTSCTSTAGTGTGTIVLTYNPATGLPGTFVPGTIDPLTGVTQPVEFANFTGSAGGCALPGTSRSPTVNASANTITITGLTLTVSETVAQTGAIAYYTYEGCGEYLGLAHFGFVHSFYAACGFVAVGTEIDYAEDDTSYVVGFDENDVLSGPTVIHNIQHHQNYAAIGSGMTAEWQIGVILPGSSTAPLTIENSSASTPTSAYIGTNYANFAVASGVGDNAILPVWDHMWRIQDGTQSTLTYLKGTDGPQNFLGSISTADPTYQSSITESSSACATSFGTTTVNTGSATTTTALSCLPANSIIDAVVYRVTTSITTAASFTVGQTGSTSQYCSTQSTLTSGATGVCIPSAYALQASAAAVLVTFNATPGAGAIRVIVYYHSFVAPTS